MLTLISLKNICLLFKFQGRPLVRRVKGGFVKLNLKVVFPKEKNYLDLLNEVLSKGGFLNLFLFVTT